MLQSCMQAIHGHPLLTGTSPASKTRVQILFLQKALANCVETLGCTISRQSLACRVFRAKIEKWHLAASCSGPLSATSRPSAQEAALATCCLLPRRSRDRVCAPEGPFKRLGTPTGGRMLASLSTSSCRSRTSLRRLWRASSSSSPCHGQRISYKPFTGRAMSITCLQLLCQPSRQ